MKKSTKAIITLSLAASMMAGIAAVSASARVGFQLPRWNDIENQLVATYNYVERHYDYKVEDIEEFVAAASDENLGTLDNYVDNRLDEIDDDVRNAHDAVVDEIDRTADVIRDIRVNSDWNLPINNVIQGATNALFRTFGIQISK